MTNLESIIATLERRFQEERDSIWTDESIPLEHKQAEVDRRWREMNAQRTEIREAAYSGGESSGGPLGRPSLIPRKRRPQWK
jgi:hypothetical protein